MELGTVETEGKLETCQNSGCRKQSPGGLIFLKDGKNEEIGLCLDCWKFYNRLGQEIDRLWNEEATAVMIEDYEKTGECLKAIQELEKQFPKKMKGGENK